MVFLCAVSNKPESSPKNDAQRIIFVMFLGGCTFSEISALRFLGRERGKSKIQAYLHSHKICGVTIWNHFINAPFIIYFPGYKFVVVTTAITNSSRMMEALFETCV